VRASRDGLSAYGTVTVIKGLDGYDAIEDLKKTGSKGGPVDTKAAIDLGDKSQQQRPGAKPQDTSGSLSSTAPQDRPDAKEPPGGDEGSTGTASIPSGGQPGMTYQCIGDDGTYVMSPVPCPPREKSLVPAYPGPSGPMAGKGDDRKGHHHGGTGQPKDPGTVKQQPPADPAAGAGCKIYHKHRDGKYYCCPKDHPL
jgi:hypothetical protein